MQSETIIQPYTLQKLAEIYCVSNGVMKKWLLRLQPELGAKTGRFYSAKQVHFIFIKLGVPHKMYIHAFEQVNMP